MSLQDHARTLARLRSENRARGQALPPGLFRATAWDMLLDLGDATARRSRVSVTGLAVGARVKPTTGLRYLEQLEQAGLAARCADPLDARRQWVQLTEAGETSLCRFLAAVEARRGQG